MLDRFSEASKLFGLTISLGKTEVLHQPAPHTNPPAPSISIDGTQLANVESFKYLGSTISHDGSLDKEITARISKASQAMGRPGNRVLNQHNIRLSTKLKMHNAVVLPSLLYGCESWTLYDRHIKQLEKVHMRVLRSMFGIRRQDRITNTEVLDRAHSSSTESMLLKTQLRWVGHVIRMEEHRMPRRLLYGELAAGKRHQGRQKKRYKDSVKANPQWCNIKPKDLESCAGDRLLWRARVRQATTSFEDARSQRLATAREQRHKTTSPVTTTEFQCLHCSRLCASRLRLRSHPRVHR